MQYSKRQFGGTGVTGESNLGFKKRYIASLLISIVQTISYSSSHSLLIGVCCKLEIYEIFWRRIGFEYTFNPECWPKPLTAALQVLSLASVENKIQCILYKVMLLPLQLLLGDVESNEMRDLDLLKKLSCNTTANEVLPDFNGAILDDISVLSAAVPSIADEDGIVLTENDMLDSCSPALLVEPTCYDNFFEGVFEPVNDDSTLNVGAGHLEDNNTIATTNNTIQPECVGNNSGLDSLAGNIGSIPVNGISTSTNSLDLGCENENRNGATAASNLTLEVECNNNNINRAVPDYDTATAAEINAAECSNSPSSKSLRRRRLNRLVRELPAYASTLNINDEDNGVATPGNINVAEASNHQDSVRLSRGKETRCMRASSLHNSTTNINYSESDDEYYFNEATYINAKNVNPRAIGEKRKSCTNGDEDDSFYKFLRCWSHLIYLRNQQFENKRYTGYIGIGYDNNGKRVRKALTVAYVEMMSGLTQGYLTDKVKQNPGFQVELPKRFKEHQKRYSMVWSGKKEYDIFLKLWNLNWTHLRFFKDPNNNAGNNRFQLKNNNNNQFMDFVPKLWFYECLSPETDTEKLLAQKLINDCKREQGNKWIEIPAGKSSTKTMLPTNNKELFKIQVKQPVGLQSCLFSSLANGFYFIGDKRTGELIENHAKISLQKIDRMKYAIELTRNKTYKYNPVRYKGELFDILNNTSEWPTLCVLLGDDYSQNHAITVVKDWILDSNSDFAMKLTKENLDWSVSTATESVGFVKVVKAIRFVQYKKSSFMLEEKPYMV